MSKFIQLENRNYAEIADYGKTEIIPTEKIDPDTGEPIMEPVHSAIWVIKQEYKEQEFVSNLVYDLKVAQDAMNSAIGEYNRIADKIKAVKGDLPDIVLPNAQLAEIVK